MLSQVLTTDDLEKIIAMIKGSPLYPEDVKEKILRKLRLD